MPPSMAREVPEERHDLRVLRSLRRILRAASIYSKKLTATHKITISQLVCLQEVVKAGPLSQVALSRRVYLSPSTLVGVLDRLERKELVRRVRSLRDRRLIEVVATPEGERLARIVPSPLQDRLAEALARLPQIERRAMAEALERVVDLMELGHADAAPILEPGPLVQEEPREEAPLGQGASRGDDRAQDSQESRQVS